MLLILLLECFVLLFRDKPYLFWFTILFVLFTNDMLILGLRIILFIMFFPLLLLSMMLLLSPCWIVFILWLFKYFILFIWFRVSELLLLFLILSCESRCDWITFLFLVLLSRVCSFDEFTISDSFCVNDWMSGLIFLLCDCFSIFKSTVSEDTARVKVSALSCFSRLYKSL